MNFVPMRAIPAEEDALDGVRWNLSQRVARVAGSRFVPLPVTPRTLEASVQRQVKVKQTNGANVAAD